MASGVFGLKKVYKRQVENINNGNFASWSEGATYGYFGGGGSIISRIDFSTEITSDPGLLPRSLDSLGATSNELYGYFVGGANPVVSTLNRLDLSNETVSDPGKYLPTTRTDFGSTKSNSFGYGYFGGGRNTPTITNLISRLNFSTETVSNPGTNLPVALYYIAATQSSSYGYFGGGGTANIPLVIVSSVTRLDFSNETLVSNITPLPSARYITTTVCNDLYGYWGGGTLPPTTSIITRIDFSNDTLKNTSNLPLARESFASVSSLAYGYFAGGVPSSSLISRLNFSNETVSNPGNNLPSTRQDFAGFSGGQSILRGKGVKTYGYFVDGNAKGRDISKIDFSNDNVSLVSTPDPVNKYPSSMSLSSNNYSYITNGLPGGAGADSIINRLDFSNDVFADTGKLLSGNRAAAGTFSSNSYGYFGGGGTPTIVSSIDRLDFSTETSIKISTVLPSARQSLAGVSNNSYGYFGGGDSPGAINTISRLDFSNETVKNPGNNLPTVNRTLGGTSSSAYGYFGGGSTGAITNIISRLDFSSETVNLPGINLPANSERAMATGGNSYGYFAGSGSQSLMKINFFTESTNLSSQIPGKTYQEGTAFSNSN